MRDGAEFVQVGGSGASEAEDLSLTRISLSHPHPHPPIPLIPPLSHPPSGVLPTYSALADAFGADRDRHYRRPPRHPGCTPGSQGGVTD